MVYAAVMWWPTPPPWLAWAPFAGTIIYAAVVVYAGAVA
jgi:hypothetical protein